MTRPAPTGPRVVVCGGGLAGVAAALEAALLGARVTLVERRPFLGGKAFSFTDPHSGADLDNGQHVFLGCCTAYVDLLRRIGSLGLTRLQPSLRAPVRDRAGRRGDLVAAPLPAPLHLGPSFASYGLLSPAQRVRAVRALAALGALTPRRRAAADGESFAGWLAAHGQGPGAIERFWDLIVLPTCNDRSDRVSAALAAFVFQEGFLRSRGGAAIGWSTVGLTRLVDPPARAALARLGARVDCGRGVTSAGPGEVTLGDGERLPADAVVLALPPGRALAACPAALPAAPALGTSPIVNVHLWLDRVVMDDPFIAVVDSPAQWLFNRRALTGREGPGQHIAVSISGARDEIGVPRDELAERIRAEVWDLLPRARRARLLRHAVVKEPQATFAAAPGQAAHRPGARTPVDGVVLAGAWTDTGWPATMEGAVRSGIRAARLAVGQAGGRTAA